MPHFIRQAIIQELQNFRERSERETMAKSMFALKKSKKYINESEELEELLNSSLPESAKLVKKLKVKYQPELLL